ncbi:tigger transposable element-derived protein [Plasmopara halstedii]|uniref:Tigger transposable element-derived protein n=1 Tax=Plasmopara halstedii TaxID=4781 RepID=A0A0P1AB64_PLAHL|nr:tigger transposable element-derived protein [Plasmopara halstedii]CEG38081.1 tigger transposable element-derived protein [Plasmopara halstedii]|eukprot:XP_024574450.1 tigger transposable element-derived protein [Plasmopara halstedii]
MDETGLFYRMQFANHTAYPTQADNSLATKQLEGHKQNKKRITLNICCNGDVQESPLFQKHQPGKPWMHIPKQCQGMEDPSNFCRMAQIF